MPSMIWPVQMRWIDDCAIGRIDILLRVTLCYIMPRFYTIIVSHAGVALFAEDLITNTVFVLLVEVPLRTRTLFIYMSKLSIIRTYQCPVEGLYWSSSLQITRKRIGLDLRSCYFFVIKTITNIHTITTIATKMTTGPEYLQYHLTSSQTNSQSILGFFGSRLSSSLILALLSIFFALDCVNNAWLSCPLIISLKN